jgi:hypothetical protein
MAATKPMRTPTAVSSSRSNGCAHPRSDSLRQGIGHRAVIERSDQAAGPVHLQVTGRPDTWRADVDGEDGISRREAIDHRGDVLRMQWRLATSLIGERVQSGPRTALMSDHSVQMSGAGLRLDDRQQRVDGVRDRAHECHVDGHASADVLAADVDLHHRDPGWVERAIGKVGAEHE